MLPIDTSSPMYLYETNDGFYCKLPVYYVKASSTIIRYAVWPLPGNSSICLNSRQEKGSAVSSLYVPVSADGLSNWNKMHGTHYKYKSPRIPHCYDETSFPIQRARLLGTEVSRSHVSPLCNINEKFARRTGSNTIARWISYPFYAVDAVLTLAINPAYWILVDMPSNEYHFLTE